MYTRLFKEIPTLVGTYNENSRFSSIFLYILNIKSDSQKNVIKVGRDR